MAVKLEVFAVNPQGGYTNVHTSLHFGVGNAWGFFSKNVIPALGGYNDVFVKVVNDNTLSVKMDWVPTK